MITVQLIIMANISHSLFRDWGMKMRELEGTSHVRQTKSNRRIVHREASQWLAIIVT